MPTLDWLNRADALTAADRVLYRVLVLHPNAVRHSEAELRGTAR